MGGNKRTFPPRVAQIKIQNLLLRGPGLPDGLFSYQESQFEKILEGLGIENVCIFNNFLEYFTAIWYILRPFGIFYGHLVNCMPVWYSFFVIWYIFPVLVCLDKSKIWQPCLAQCCH
jgi:cellulose synthase/poly-beta-1,6-N-acetylglucosamine synthase-like glycosyltransferase